MLKILKSVEVEVIESTTRGDVLLDLLLTSAEELTGERSGLEVACNAVSDHTLVEFPVLRDVGRAKSRIDPKPQKGKLSVIRALVHRIPWETALGDQE